MVLKAREEQIPKLLRKLRELFSVAQIVGEYILLLTNKVEAFSVLLDLYSLLASLVL